MSTHPQTQRRWTRCPPPHLPSDEPSWQGRCRLAIVNYRANVKQEHQRTYPQFSILMLRRRLILVLRDSRKNNSPIFRRDSCSCSCFGDLLRIRDSSGSCSCANPYCLLPLVCPTGTRKTPATTTAAPRKGIQIVGARIPPRGVPRRRCAGSRVNEENCGL